VGTGVLRWRTTKKQGIYELLLSGWDIEMCLENVAEEAVSEKKTKDVAEAEVRDSGQERTDEGEEGADEAGDQGQDEAQQGRDDTTDLTDDGGDVGTCTCTAGDAGHGAEGSEHNAEDGGKQCGDLSNVSGPEDGLEGAASEALHIGDSLVNDADHLIDEGSQCFDAEIAGCERSNLSSDGLERGAEVREDFWEGGRCAGRDTDCAGVGCDIDIAVTDNRDKSAKHTVAIEVNGHRDCDTANVNRRGK